METAVTPVNTTKDSIRSRIYHVLLSFLFSLGLILPILFAVSFERYWLYGTLCALVVPVLIALLSHFKKTGILVLVALVAWQGAELLFIPGGGAVARALVATGKALMLYLGGQQAALPLYALECTIILSVGISLLAYIVSSRGAGFMPALALVLLSMLGVWFAGRQDLLLYCLPSLCALVALYVQNVHEDMPIAKVLPVAAIVVALSFLILPAQRVVYPPLEKLAETIRQTIADYLLFKEPRIKFDLTTQGYYTHEAASPNPHEIMLVTTSEKVLLRSTIKDTYNGRSWSDSSGGGRRYLYVSPGNKGLREGLFNETIPSPAITEGLSLMATSTVTVEMLNDSATTLFLPQRFRDLHLDSGMVPYFNVSSEVFITRNLAYGDRYTVEAILFEAGDPALRAVVNALDGSPDVIYDNLGIQYYDLPTHLQNAVSLSELLANIIGNQETPYDKALAIQNYLQRGFRYTLSPPAIPQDRDLVAHLLLDTKEGYCTHFASAMTVLARMAGLPARYIEGFVANPSADGTARLTGYDAHAWCEIYFQGFGWVPFDATPADPDNPASGNTETPPSPPDDQGSPEQSPEPTPTPTPEPPNVSPAPQDMETPTPESSDENQPSDEPSPTPSDTPDDKDPRDLPAPKPPEPPSFLFYLILFLVAALAAAVLRILYINPHRMAARKKNSYDVFLTWVGATYGVLRLDKMTPKPSESPLAFAARANDEKPYPISLTPMAEIISYVQYSRHEVDGESIALVKETFESVYHPLSRVRKMRFAAMRAFFPMKNYNPHFPKKARSQKPPKALKKASHKKNADEEE